MKIYLLITLTVFTISCNAQKNKNNTKNNDDEIVKDFIKKLNTPNDTIFDEFNRPNAIKLSDDIFGATIQKIEYDTINRTVKKIGFDNNGIIKPFYHDIAIELTTYDTKGNIIEIRSYGENGKLISAEFEDTPIIQKKYNDKNQLVEEWYLNEKAKLRAEFAICKYSYSQTGEIISTEWYNQKGEKEE